MTTAGSQGVRHKLTVRTMLFLHSKRNIRILYFGARKLVTVSPKIEIGKKADALAWLPFSRQYPCVVFGAVLGQAKKSEHSAKQGGGMLLVPNQAQQISVLRVLSTCCHHFL